MLWLVIVFLVLLVLSGVGMIVFILMHSMYSSQTGTSIIEKNLDRITIICAIVFMVSLLVLMVIYPQGVINS